LIAKQEFITQGNRHISKVCPDTTSLMMAASAMNTSTLEVLDLKSYMNGTKLEWDAPQGEWRVMFFVCKMNVNSLVDYMQPEAVDKLMEMTYAEYDKRFSKYFGNVITKTFFDDVGFVNQEETWTPAITKIFENKYKKNPALYYPALYYNIGPETESARIAFYDIRSELMAEGYVKKVSEWAAKRNMKSMGHPPENYSPNSVVAHGDVLKYYRHVQIPLLDAIFYYGRGVNGFKQVSSAADLGDKPIVGAELCGAFPADMDSLTLYRVVMESMVRGVNFVVPHGMWYDSDPRKVAIPPLISHENPLLGKCLPNYSNYVARSCMMLQDGRHVSDIAILSPIASVQAGSYMYRDKTSGLPIANWVPENVNHHQLSDLLTNHIRRDFTFIHPEDLCNGKITANGKELRLNNTTNIQNYKVLIMPGGEVISAATLKVIKDYYDNGGKVIATASLPFKSAEFDQDKEVQSIITEIFGVEPFKGVSIDLFKSNAKGGQFAFLKTVTKESLDKLFDQMNLPADIRFDESTIQANKIGYFNYIHKQKDKKDIYFLTNTTENAFTTIINLRGAFRKLEYWNPHTGKIQTISDVEQVKQSDGTYTTKVNINIPAVFSMFIVGLPK